MVSGLHNLAKTKTGMTSPYLFHQSPIELRSQTAGSMNYTHRHLSDLRREAGEEEDEEGIFERESVEA